MNIFVGITYSVGLYLEQTSHTQNECYKNERNSFFVMRLCMWDRSTVLPSPACVCRSDVPQRQETYNFMAVCFLLQWWLGRVEVTHLDFLLFSILNLRHWKVQRKIGKFLMHGACSAHAYLQNTYHMDGSCTCHKGRCFSWTWRWGLRCYC